MVNWKLALFSCQAGFPVLCSLTYLLHYTMCKEISDKVNAVLRAFEEYGLCTPFPDWLLSLFMSSPVVGWHGLEIHNRYTLRTNNIKSALMYINTNVILTAVRWKANFWSKTYFVDPPPKPKYHGLEFNVFSLCPSLLHPHCFNCVQVMETI